MKTTFSFLLALALPLTAAAQAPTDTDTTYKHQLGLTASPVLDGFFKNNRSLPLGLIYKRQTAPNQAWRVRAEVLYRYFKQEAPLSVNEGLSGEKYSQHEHRFELAVGKEYLLPFTGHFTGYAGLDLGAFYFPSKREFEVYNGAYQAIGRDGLPYTTTAVSRGKSSLNAWGIILQPMVGLRYQFYKRLYVAAEATAPVRWTQTHFLLGSRVTDYATGTLPFGSGRGKDIFRNLTASLRPVSAIHLVFLF